MIYIKNWIVFFIWSIAYVLARTPRRWKDTEKLELIQRKGTKLVAEQGGLHSERPNRMWYESTRYQDIERRANKCR